MFDLHHRISLSSRLARPRLGWSLFAILILLLSAAGSAPAAAAAAEAAPLEQSPAVYQNPLPITIPGDGMVESCADPTIIYGQTPGDNFWYMYCTTDPLNGDDRNAAGDFNFRLIPILRSADLVSWEYVGDAFQTRPDWVADDAGLWAPDIQYFNDQYYLYYTAPNTDLPGGGSAIGVATAPTPTGPWTDSGYPAVEPHAPACCPDAKRWTFDASIIKDDSGQRWIYYGSYFGGISVRKLSADGLTSDPASETLVTIANRYEGAFVIRRGEFYYLFASATDCCRGPLTGYSVFVGRSTAPTGPFLDQDGVSLLAGRVGGTPVLSMNGNQWVGLGHNAVFTDFDGKDWFLYHAIDRNDPYFSGAVGFTKRPVLMDPLTWVDGWPTVRGGLWASDTPQPAPAAQPGETSRVLPVPYKELVLGKLLVAEDFSGDTLGSQWSWVRPPADGTYRLTGDGFAFDTQPADIYVDSNNASLLVMDAPDGPYIVEARVHLNLPAEGCCFNYVQGGLVIYGDDDNFIKLTHVSIWETRQTEFAKEEFPVPDGYPRYGNTVVTAPGEWTWLRIAVQERDDEQLYTAYTSDDGENWFRGGTWVHALGEDAKIALVSMGGSGFTTTFDYVNVYRLNQDVIK
jgi:arabinan endo-1,5-alpha-L-arabinosidase